MSQRNRDVVLAELAHVADELTGTLATEAQLYTRRLRLLQEGRAMDPPITQGVLAATAKVSEEAVIQVLRKQAMIDAHQAGEHTTAVPKCPECKKASR